MCLGVLDGLLSEIQDGHHVHLWQVVQPGHGGGQPCEEEADQAQEHGGEHQEHQGGGGDAAQDQGGDVSKVGANTIEYVGGPHHHD